MSAVEGGAEDLLALSFQLLAPKHHLHEPLRGLESKRLARDGKSHDGSVFIGARSRSGVPASKLKALGRRNRGDTEMAETAAYPYATHLDIKFDPLTLIDVSSLAKTVTDQWYNQTLCKVNESVIRLGVMQGEYHWHKHDNDDEFFFVLSGRFIIDLEGHSIELLPNQGFTVPKGVLHCTRAPERSVILMVETAAIVPTGDA
jgi:mannose-6-phosphate isomerase-like protein (cupin superfamily)